MSVVNDNINQSNDNINQSNDDKIAYIENIRIIKLLDYFGDIKYNTFNSLVIFNNLGVDEEFAKVYIKDVINNILQGTTDKINIILIEESIRKFVSSDEGIISLINIIYETVLEYAIKCGEKIQKKILELTSKSTSELTSKSTSELTSKSTSELTSKSTSELTSELTSKSISELTSKSTSETKFTFINEFMNEKNDYYSKLSKMGIVLKLVNDYVSLTNNNSKLFDIIINYTYYKGILERKYIYKDQTQYIFSILIELVNKNDKNDIFNVFKIINTYKGFSYSLKDKKYRNAIFILELANEKYQKILDYDTMNEFVNYIDKDIRKLYAPNLDNKMKLIEDITDNIYMCQRIGDIVTFMTLYHRYLQQRFLDMYIDINHNMDYNVDKVSIERTIAKLLKYDTSTADLYIMIGYVLNDIKGIEFVNNEFRRIEINFNSGKYTEHLQQTFDVKKTNYNILRKSSWNIVSESNIDRIIEPENIAIYLDIFQKYYTKFFDEKIQ